MTANTKTLDMVYIALFAVIMTICAWISIPVNIPFTLQTLGVFLAVTVLGGKRGTLAVLVYILLGAVGIPVFSGFMGGIGVILSNTGGYIIGFLFLALVMWGMEKLIGTKTWALILTMFLGLIVCYTFGTVWFLIMYADDFGREGISAELLLCVVPFIVPDMLKMALALLIRKRIRKAIRLD